MFRRIDRIFIVRRVGELDVAVMVISTLLNAGYFLPIVYRAYAQPAGEGKGRAEPSWLIVAPLLAWWWGF